MKPIITSRTIDNTYFISFSIGVQTFHLEPLYRGDDDIKTWNDRRKFLKNMLEKAFNNLLTK